MRIDDMVEWLTDIVRNGENDIEDVRVNEQVTALNVECLRRGGSECGWAIRVRASIRLGLPEAGGCNVRFRFTASTELDLGAAVECDGPGVDKSTEQTILSSFRKKLADIIWDGKDEEEIEEYPDIVEIEEEYKRIFEKPEVDGSMDNERVDYGIDISYSPITKEDLEKILKEMKPTAPGSDGITIENIRIIPDILRKNRTTLIPKGGNLKDIKIGDL
ncbi:hypothetical protein CBL_12335 [Carabus blaptoides fortunei]